MKIFTSRSLKVSLLILVLASLVAQNAEAQAIRTANRAPAQPCPITGCPITIHGSITDRWDILSAPGSEWVYYTETVTTAPMATLLVNSQTTLSQYLVRGTPVTGPVAIANPPVPECCFLTNYTRTPIYLSDAQGIPQSSQPSFEVVQCQPASFVCVPQYDWLRIQGVSQPEQLFKTQ